MAAVILPTAGCDAPSYRAESFRDRSLRCLYAAYPIAMATVKIARSLVSVTIVASTLRSATLG
jgi:hypothetical protein